MNKRSENEKCEERKRRKRRRRRGTRNISPGKEKLVTEIPLLSKSTANFCHTTEI